MTVDMAQKAVAPVQMATRASWTLFANAMLCTVSCGTYFWLPALAQGLRVTLGLSPSDFATVLVVGSAGGVLCFVGGALYKTVGARMTTVIGGCTASLSYLFLAFLVRYRARNVGKLVAAIALCMHTASHFVYTAQLAVGATAFPRNRRGQVVGFLTAVYGMSAGVCGVLQSSFFPRVENTESLLFCIAAFTAAPAVMAPFLLPGSTPVSVAEKCIAGEQTPILPQGKGNDARLMAAAFVITILLMADLQFGAYATWAKLPPMQLGIFAVPAEFFALILIVLLFGALRILPFCFRTTRRPVSCTPAMFVSNDNDGIHEVNGVPFSTVLLDFRSYLLFANFFVLPGCGTATTLIRVGEIAASRMFAEYQGGIVPPEVDAANTIGRTVRSAIVAFSACNLGSRLVIGTVADLGGKGREEQEAWKLKLLILNLLVMGTGTLGVAFSTSWGLILFVGAIGFAQGSFFALAPTLISFWFGVDGLIIYLPLIESGLLVAAVLVPSMLASRIENKAMQDSFVDIVSNGSLQRYCVGFHCFAPTLCLISALNFALAAVYFLLRRRVVSASSRYSRLTDCASVASSNLPTL